MPRIERSDYVARNDRERARLRALVERLTDDQLRLPVNEHWTIAALMAHIAFWDARVVVLADKLERGLPFTESDIEPDDVTWINDSYRALAHAIAPREAARYALRQAETTDARVAALSPERVWPNDPKSLINPLRASHRAEHLDDIDAVLPQA